MTRYLSTKHQYIKEHAKSGIYYFRGTVAGRFVEKSLRTENWELAKTRANKVVQKVESGDSGDPTMPRTFNDAFDLLEKIQSSKSARTLTMAKTQLKHLRPWFAAHCRSLSEFDRSYEEVWAEYKLDQARLTPGRKLEHDRRHLLMALKRAKVKGWIRRDFAKRDLPLQETSEPVGRYLTDEEVGRLLAALRSHEKTYLQVLMALTMGMRISEILHLRLDEIDLKAREIHLDAGRVKTRRRREVPIPIAEDVLPLLKRAAKAAPGAFLFPAQHTNVEGQPIDPTRPQDDNRYHWERARDAAKVDARFHDLRHTCITNLLKNGMPEIAVRKICGVSEQVIRAVYAHIETELKDRFRGFFTGRFVEGSR